MDAPRPFGRLRLAATVAASALALAGAWSPLATRPAPSLQGADGLLDLGTADVVLQRRPDTCALAVLVMLLRHAGLPGDEDALARLSAALGEPEASSRQTGGTSLARVQALASAAGLPGRWLRASDDALGAVPLPFAAELAPDEEGRPGHLVLVRRVDPTGILVADPERGLTGWPHEAFLRAWTGRVFVADAR